MPVLTVKKYSPLSTTSGRWTAAASRSAICVASWAASDAGADDDELVAADPRDGVRGAHGGGQAGSEREQDGVAGGVAERVVDQLEPVEIERQDRDVDALTLPAGERVREPVERQRPVRQRGQRIVQRRVPRRLLGRGRA